jgi:hypothetical protein
MICMAVNAQKPLSGTYKIGNEATGKYVEVTGKYYAKPDAENANASEIYVGVGIKNSTVKKAGVMPTESYRIFSLKDNKSGVEVFDYVDKAVRLVEQLFSDHVDNSAAFKSLNLSTATVSELKAAADQVMQIYADQYAFLSLEPTGRTIKTANGNYAQIVCAKATVPAIPTTIDAACKKLTNKDAWTWAKNEVYEYLDTHATDATLKAYVRNNLEKINPGTTYWLTADADGTFGYADYSADVTRPTAANWILSPVSTEADALQNGVYNINNVGTGKYVEVYGKYQAEPRLSSLPNPMTLEGLVNTSIKLELGRVSRTDKNLYQITELSGRGADVCQYITKAINLTKTLAQQKLAGKEATLTSLLSTFGVTFDQFMSDVNTAIDLTGEEYCNLKLVNNGSNVSLYMAVPEIPALIDHIYKKYKNDQTASAWTWAKAQIMNYIDNSQTDASLKALVRQNLEKITPGTTYYLSAENGGTFEMATSNATDNEKWNLALASANANNKVEAYVRVANAAGINGKKYVEVRGRATAEPDVLEADKYTKAGTVLKLLVQPDANGLTVKELRSQNVSPVHYVQVMLDLIKKSVVPMFTLVGLDADKEILQKFDANMYIQPTLTTDNRAAYYAYATFPDMNVVTNFIKAHNDVITSARIAKVYGILCMNAQYATLMKNAGYDTAAKFAAAFENGDSLLNFGKALFKALAASRPDQPAIATVSYYLSRINNGQTYYAMEGRVDKKADTEFNPPYITNGVNGNVMNATSATLGFCNNNTTLDTWYGPELPVAGDYAKWMIEPIDDSNYFGVTCLTNPDVKDAAGNWYATAYFDFPFTVNNGDAFYISKTTTDKANNIYTATATKIDGVVPAQTPVLLRVKGATAETNKITPVYQETEVAPISNNLLKGGEYADAGKTGTINDLYDGGDINVNILSFTVENMFAANTAWFFGTTIPTAKVGKGYYHTLDVSNKNGKVGFYFYTGSTLAGNKAYLYFDTPIFNSVAEADGTTGNAKNFVLQFSDDETTGITNINNDETNKGDNKIYDLQGRQVTTPSHGIYIINGKKILVK